MKSSVLIVPSSLKSAMHGGRTSTRKAEALLAYLAFTPGKARSRDQLAGLLWSDRAETQAHDGTQPPHGQSREYAKDLGIAPGFRKIVENSGGRRAPHKPMRGRSRLPMGTAEAWPSRHTMWRAMPIAGG